MAYRIFSFLILILLMGCESSRDITPVESGKVVVVKKWSKEQDTNALGTKSGDLNSVVTKDESPWASYDRAFSKNYQNSNKAGREDFGGEASYNPTK